MQKVAEILIAAFAMMVFGVLTIGVIVELIKFLF